MPEITVGAAQAQDYEQLITLLDEVFFAEDSEQPPRNFLTLLPKLYKREYQPWKDNYCVWEDGVLQAAVGMYVYDTEIAGQPLRIGGIGNVAVSRSCRGKGYMKLAMNAAMDAMRAAGCAIGELGGQRQRYQYWGFERGGAAVHASFSETNLRHIYGKNKLAEGWRIEKVQPQAQETLAKIQALAEAQPLHYKHNAAQFYDCLCSWNETPYAIWKGERLAGFFTLSRGGESVSQFLLDRADDLEMALRAAYTLLEEGSWGKSMQMTIPLWQRDLLQLAEVVSENSNTITDTGSYTILQWKGALQALLLLQAQCKALPDGEITLAVQNAETLRICVQGVVPSVEAYADTPQYSFTHLEAMRFVLSPHTVLRYGDAPAQSWFPLPLRLMGIDTV